MSSSLFQIKLKYACTSSRAVANMVVRQHFAKHNFMNNQCLERNKHKTSIPNFTHTSDKCFKAHSTMPYQWEVKEGLNWTALQNNEVIEKDYCDPAKTYRWALRLRRMNLNGQ